MKKYNPVKHPYINNNDTGIGNYYNIYQYNPYLYHFDFSLYDNDFYENNNDSENNDNKEIFTNVKQNNKSI